MNSRDRDERDSEIRAAIWQHASEALLGIEDEGLRQYVAQQLHAQGQSRVTGNFDAEGNPDSFLIRLDVLMPDGWKTLRHLRPADIGLTAEEVAQEIQFVRYQSGMDIPANISGLTDPPDDR
jgi:hypothetical protein